ncbi:Putative toxin-antitoxin system, toxin component, PIN family [Desulfonema limicola]|uniref:Toxin-antitoxin system, toxin component, PIN family n=2 Tax=Desulfonema limicola TaxID=45656 RepID=A0A975GH28_9BACT|nr:Putative toxin-antitoxin system, toxin component, PIN family [Desulfonema limicola]
MIITADTNVIFSALYSIKGASHYILRLILEEKIKLAISPQVYFEYYDVLTRKENLEKLGMSACEIEDILDLLALLAQKHSIYFLLRPNLTDENDNMICECAFASSSKYLITSNIRDFKGGELKGFGFRLITPRDFCIMWRAENE